ncbi:MAG: NADH:ubiquinone reductase (Na(+)-transporting) subunit C [Alistipes sp.]
MNKNSNLYIIIYSTVMVVIVAILLSVAALSLQAKQTANELNEKKNSILGSLGADPLQTNFDDYVKAYLIDQAGAKTTIEAKDAFDMMKSNKNLREAIADKKFILFEASDGRVVIPIIGKGLWDDVWGYVALEKDMNTVSGIVLAHKGETPGLGAEIATVAHEQLYKGKQLFNNGEFVSIVLRKGGAKDPLHEVDAISGGTKTSDGVTAMLRNCLENYVPFFLSAKPQVAGLEELHVVEGLKPQPVSNEENVESNE